MNHYAFTLPLQGYVPRGPIISILLSPSLRGIQSRSSQQSVLEAQTLPLSYRGRAQVIWYVRSPKGDSKNKVVHLSERGVIPLSPSLFIIQMEGGDPKMKLGGETRLLGL